MADTITCPNCHADIPLSDAVTHSLREEFDRAFSEKQRRLEQEMASRQKEVDAQRQKNEAARAELDREVAQRLAAEKKKLTEQALREAKEGFALELQDARTQLVERSQKLEEAQRNELTLRNKQREVEERAKNLELEVQRKVDEQTSRLEEDARRRAAEEQHLRLADKDKLINDLKTQIETLKQKAEQGSQQSQGEVMELELEDLLKEAFVLDEFLPVPQGTRGADLLQKVRNNLGHDCGTIIWESKRTKNWSPAWLGKLKDDQRAQGAELAILVSQVLPDGVSHGGHRDGIWICNFPFALALAAALRNGLLQVSAAKRAESGKDEKMAVLYQFLTSPQFKHQIEGVVESFVEMKKDLDGERRAMERLWKKREMQLTRVLNGTSGLYGSLQGIMGSTALPEIKALELGGEEETAAPAS